MGNPSNDGSITPEDSRDVEMLLELEGAFFGSTTFPSGWKCPPGVFLAKGGKLWPATRSDCPVAVRHDLRKAGLNVYEVEAEMMLRGFEHDPR